MEDIVPKLLDLIQKDFQKKFENNKKIKVLYENIKNGKSTYKEANEFAIHTGRILSNTFQMNFSTATLPDGKLYYNIADRTIRPMMKKNYDLVSDMCERVQEILNRESGIGIKGIPPKLNEDKIQGIIDIVSGKEKYEDVAYMLGEPIVNFTQSIVDDAVRANADFQYRAGLSPKIRRTSTGKCCNWCDKIAGVYNYEDVSNTGNNVFRRHKYCRCTIEYEPGDGKRQNVHTKKWENDGKSDIIIKKELPEDREKRIKIENGLDFASRIAEHPKVLESYTPESLYKALRSGGYDVKPIKGKNYRDVPFEDGGGYKVNFGGDGVFLYHPGERSHHGGEYYKISTGKGGTRRYDREGNEIEKDR